MPQRDRSATTGLSSCTDFVHYVATSGSEPEQKPPRLGGGLGKLQGRASC
jgi:hypothetical protein